MMAGIATGAALARIWGAGCPAMASGRTDSSLGRVPASIRATLAPRTVVPSSVVRVAWTPEAVPTQTGSVPDLTAPPRAGSGPSSMCNCPHAVQRPSRCTRTLTTTCAESARYGHVTPTRENGFVLGAVTVADADPGADRSLSSSYDGATAAVFAVAAAGNGP